VAPHGHHHYYSLRLWIPASQLQKKNKEEIEGEGEDISPHIIIIRCIHTPHSRPAGPPPLPLPEFFFRHIELVLLSYLERAVASSTSS
jgi:hypothetical protein